LQFFKNSGKSDVDGEVKRLILGYMNGIQAIYMLPSLGRLIPLHLFIYLFIL
jgi:hypothetical protein